jgi:hypothetical protein
MNELNDFVVVRARLVLRRGFSFGTKIAKERGEMGGKFSHGSDVNVR